MWTSLISELLQNGLTQQEIAAACETTQSSISDLLNGKRQQPSWQLGDALLRLHKKMTKTKAA